MQTKKDAPQGMESQGMGGARDSEKSTPPHTYRGCRVCLDRKFLLTGILVFGFSGLLFYVSPYFSLIALTVWFVLSVMTRVEYMRGYECGYECGVCKGIEVVVRETGLIVKHYEGLVNEAKSEARRMALLLDREKSRNARAERVRSECIEHFEKRLEESESRFMLSKRKLEISEKARSVDIKILNALRKIETGVRKQLNSATDELEVIRSRLAVSDKVCAATAGTCEAWKRSCLEARCERDELQVQLYDSKMKLNRKLNKKRDKNGRFCK